MHRWLFSLLLLLGACSADEPPQALAPHVDLDRYAGRWYIIANIPYFAERGKVGSWFDIRFTAPDRFEDVYWGRPESLDAPAKSFTMRGYVVPDTGNAYWRESPFWPLYLSYLILYVDPEYRTALVGYPGRNYGWVLSRTPTIDDATYQDLLKRFAEKGYDPSKFVRIPQRPD
ncbi:MAG: lipocalin family protein [Rhodospirillales bacterium]|nr:lipocalin family protein [Rhodospirillales bacterium]